MAPNLGMPTTPAQVLAPRRASRQLILKHHSNPLPVGGDAPVSVQSMATTLTADVNATLQQIAELTASGCQAVRVAVPSSDDAEASGGVGVTPHGHGLGAEEPVAKGHHETPSR